MISQPVTASLLLTACAALFFGYAAWRKSSTLTLAALILGYYVTRRWYPLSPSVRTIIRDEGCDACDIEACAATGTGDGTLRCLRAISVEEVLEGLAGLERAGVG